MSLFGGDDTTSADEQHGSVSGSGLQGEQDGVQSASEGDAQDLAPNRDEDSTVWTPEITTRHAGFVDEYEKDEERPNKYHGPPATWRSHTEAERKLVASIDQVRAADLSSHLYNAHLLKKRARHPDRAAVLPNWKSKDRWRVLTGQVGREGETARGDCFCPPRGWTAWPMKSELVPREGEKSLSRDFRAGGIYRSGFAPKDSRSSEHLKECVFAEMLKVAKESFLKRKTEDGALKERNERAGTPSRSGSSRREAAESSRSRERRESTSADEEDSPGAEQTQSPSPSLPFSDLALMADDEEAHNLLHPAVRHVLSKLDTLFKGLHQARESYFSSSSDDGSNGHPEATEDILEDAEPRRRTPSSQISETPRNSRVRTTARRGRGRPPKHPGVVIVHKPSPTKNQQEELYRGKGRPRKYPKGFEEQQTYYMMRKLEKQGGAAEPPTRPLHDEIPSEYYAGSESENASQSESESEVSDYQLSGGPSMPTSSSRMKKRRRIGEPVRKARYSKKKQAQLGLRDWSDVLGIASMVGWDPDVVLRATERCSKLFGEGMRFRTLNEGDTFLKEARNGVILDYYPDKMPPLNPESTETASQDPSTAYADGEEYEPRALPDHIWEQIEVVRGEGRESKDPWSPLEDRLLRQVKALRPPLSFRQIAEYFPKRSIAACKSHWRWMKVVEEDEGKESQDDDMIGGLHNDGFLRPIKRQRGWRGEDHQQRKIRKIHKGEGEVTAGRE